MTETPSTMSKLTPKDIEIATRAADQFTRIYYAAYDGPSRLADLPPLYRSSSSLTWNGTPHQGTKGLEELATQMPPTKHEIQSFDCHPILGTHPPPLLVTVSGTVVHGHGPVKNPPDITAKSLEGQSRVFSQTFLLVPDTSAAPTKPGELGRYYVGADALRFVG